MKFLALISISTLIIVSSCSSGPKQIAEDQTTTSNPETQQPEMPADSSQTGGMHDVIATEVLQSERYTYLKVKEKAEEYWIATSKIDAQKGKQYFYRGGLLKTNFESIEFKRTFDKIFLVSEIIDAEAHPGTHEHNTTPAVVNVQPNEVSDVKGSIKLADLMAQKDKLNNKMIVVTGKAVKVNYGIMDKNWVHIQDGTKANGKNADLTITTTENIEVGANVVFEGKLVLNKDFGAGYKYDLILENAKLK